MKNKNSISYLLSRLNEISEKLENEETEIETSLELYEEGMKIASETYRKLKEAELKVKTIQENFEKNNNNSEAASLFNS